jgi:hypothetical protein
MKENIQHQTSISLLGIQLNMYFIVRGKLEELQKLMEWAKDVLTPQELNNRFFLAKNHREYTT